MARRFRKELRQWTKGAIVADVTGSKVPEDAASRARNTAWKKGGWPMKREGCTMLNASAQTGKNPFLALGNAIGLNWVIDNAGRWSKWDSGTKTIGAIDSLNTTPFTSGNRYPSTTVAKNLLFACNGTDAKKTDGTKVWNWGIVAPAAPTVTDSGLAGNPSGTYLVALTAYNSNTGHESSLGASGTVTVSGHTITVSWTFPTDPQVTHVRVHVFKQGLTSQFFRAGSTDVSPTPDPTTGGYTSGTTSITLNLSDSDINNLIIESPSTTENNPPPANITYCAWHNGRMFVTDGTYLYFSKVNDPESFDPQNFEVINTGDNQSIVGFQSLADYQMIIWKDRSSHVLSGPNDPNVWEIDPLDPTVGLSSKRAVLLTEGAIWWEAIQGLFRLEYSSSGLGHPKRMDAPNISDRLENLNDALIGSSVGAYDAVNQRLFFAVPDANSTSRNTEILPWNNKYGIWEDTWDPMDVSAMGTFLVNSIPIVVIGGYQGRLFQLWTTPFVDGARQTDGVSVTFTLSGTVGSATANSLTDPTATFDTAGDGLTEMVVVAVSPAGLVQRNIINSNTGTVLTLLNNWAVTPDNTWTYYIANPWFEFDTSYIAPTSSPTEGAEYMMRTFKRLFIRAGSDTGAKVDLYSIKDGDVSAFGSHGQFTVLSGGSQWDNSLWDVGKFGTSSTSAGHLGLGVRARTLGIRVQSRNPGESVVLLELGLFGTEQSYKS